MSGENSPSLLYCCTLIIITDSVSVWRISRLMRDGTAEPVSRDQIVLRERGQGKLISVRLTVIRIDIFLLRLIQSLL